MTEPTTTPAPPTASDWTTAATDAIERAVETVREKTVEPVQAATRGIVYGLLAGCLVVVAALLVTIAAFRLLVIAFQGEVWAAWLTLGGIFVVVGGVLWTKRWAYKRPV